MTMRLTDYVSEEEFNNADPTAGGVRHPKIEVDGAHIVRVEGVRLFHSQRANAAFLAVDYVLLVSTAEGLIRAGNTYAWVHDASNKFFGASRLKQFFAAAAGFDPESPEAAALTMDEAQAIIDQDLVRGRYVRLETARMVTRANRPFVTHAWMPASEDERKRAQAVEAQLREGTYVHKAVHVQGQAQAQAAAPSAPTQTPAQAAPSASTQAQAPRRQGSGLLTKLQQQQAAADAEIPF